MKFLLKWSLFWGTFVHLPGSNQLRNALCLKSDGWTTCRNIYGCQPKNRGVSPQIIHFNRVFHYKPSILGYPYFWFNTHMEKDWLQKTMGFFLIKGSARLTYKKTATQDGFFESRPPRFWQRKAIFSQATNLFDTSKRTGLTFSSCHPKNINLSSHHPYIKVAPPLVKPVDSRLKRASLHQNE